ncbi:hypothetical protein E1A91_A11G356900v1 [Gossypium mustelinum]|nr:hypothetical protein E1A91_A11G356900v1 [Gossypium mustelinum]TYJ12516.1 hypothetical protein E1A91_A11G356900v1 [Gossypium mustelinum]
MAEAIAFDLALELITKLSSFTLSQIGPCWNVKDDLLDLKSTVSTIKAVLLDAEERSVTSHLVKDWLEKLRDVLYDADDLLDDFSTEALRKDLLGGNKLTKEHLTSLEDFSVSNCKELELSAAGIQIFQNYTSLCSLSLENIPECRHLPEWRQHLTNLQKLDLIDFPNLKSLPDEMRCLTNLQILEIVRVPQLEERCRKDIGADWHKIAHIPEILLIQ